MANAEELTVGDVIKYKGEKWKIFDLDLDDTKKAVLDIRNSKKGMKTIKVDYDQDFELVENTILTSLKEEFDNG